MKNSLVLILLLVMFSCVNNKPRRPIAPKPSTTIFSNTTKELKKLNKVEDDKIKVLIENDSTRTYIKSQYGFWYTYEKQVNEELATPKESDVVEIKYNIKDLKDNLIYSEQELGLLTYKVDKEDFISGLQRGIKLMKTGETITFVLPSYTAFGITGDGNKIGINTSIKSTVTLLNIK